MDADSNICAIPVAVWMLNTFGRAIRGMATGVRCRHRSKLLSGEPKYSRMTNNLTMSHWACGMWQQSRFAGPPLMRIELDGTAAVLVTVFLWIKPYRSSNPVFGLLTLLILWNSRWDALHSWIESILHTNNGINDKSIACCFFSFWSSLNHSIQSGIRVRTKRRTQVQSTWTLP